MAPRKKYEEAASLDRSIRSAKRWLRLAHDPSHDFNHAKSVAQTARKICLKLKYKNIKLVETACWWHDVGRLFGPVHEELSAQMARVSLLGSGASAEQANKIYESIRFHKWNMNPTSLEGNILRDADKIDFVSAARWRRCIKKRKLEGVRPMIPLRVYPCGGGGRR